MAARLEQIRLRSDPLSNGFMSRERAIHMRRGLQSATNLVDRLDWRGGLAIELLNSGESEAALEEFALLGKGYAQNGGEEMRENLQRLRLYAGVSFMRLGEQENCLANHNRDSCLFPIEGGGLYQIQRGPRAAIPLFSARLRENPADLSTRWLLNIAYMTLGEHPKKVPDEWVINPAVFDSGYDITRFTDIAGEAGVNVNDLAGGCVSDDFDGDGFIDIMASTWGFQGQLRLFRNDGSGKFSDQTRAAGLVGETGGLNLIQADYDNDGFADVLVLRGAWMGNGGCVPNSLLRNNGNGTFTDVTEEAGLLSLRPTQTAVWFDYNNDGWIDLFVGNESADTDVYPCELFRNNGDGTFTECAERMGVGVVAFVKGVVSADYNNDGRADLYLSCKGEPNRLYRNDGPAGDDRSAAARWRFTEVGAVAGVTEPLHGFTTWFWDYDQDGWEDLFVCGYNLRAVGDVLADYLGQPHPSERARLFRNNRDGTFKDVTAEVGLYKLLHGMGANYGDLDNDGWPDCHIGTGDPNLWTIIPNRTFRNAGGRSFQDVTTSGGLGNLQKGHGVSFADFDNDGDQDIYEVMGGAFSGDSARNTLFENPGHRNHWVTLKLEGTRSNRGAIGARIKVVTETASGERAIYKTVSSGGSFGASPLRQEMGLGAATRILRVEVFWPATGRTQILTGLAMDRFYRVREGAVAAEIWELRSFQFAGN